MKIGVTSIGTATSVGLITNIRKYDSEIEIIGLDINDMGYTAGSQLVDKYYKVPYAVDSNFFPCIRDTIEKEGIDAFIPVNDTEILSVAGRREEILPQCTIIIPEYNVVKLVQDKLRMNEKASTWEIQVPQIRKTPTKTRCIIRDRQGVGSKGIKICRSFDDFSGLREDQFVQDFVDGDEYTVDVLSDREGRPCYIIPRRRIEVKSGVATKAEIIHDESLIKDVGKLLEKLKIPGFCNVQFIKGNDGTNWFIEVNPRIGGFSNASLLASPDMFSLFMKMLKQEDCTVTTMNPGIKWGAVVTRYYRDILYEK